MSGRGRDINNAPAWQSYQQQPHGSRGPDADYGRRGPPPRDYGGGGYHRSPPPRGPPPRGRYEPYDRRGDYDRRGSRGRGYGRGPSPRRRRANHQLISFTSLEHEREWVEERRRKRHERPSKFDKEPTAEQLAADAAAAALSNPSATDFAGVSIDNLSVVPQQTRHARRIYIGNLPAPVSEDEIHHQFRQAIEQALVDETLQEDPILSVYIDHNRHFCFLEFKTVEMATACLELDGMDLGGKGKVKIKRPNDYNPLQAPKVHPSALPKLDASRLGIIGSTVADGPNKIFIGGLHYHLQEPQILELLHAFGKVKAFHLVKATPDADTSKGYCFVEYANPAVTPVAIQGLHGMDIGGGKSLTARLAGDRGGGYPDDAAAAAAQMSSVAGAPPPDRNIVSGFDIEQLVDAAMGQCSMPTAPQYLDAMGNPLTRIVAVVPTTATTMAGTAVAPTSKTRILVLHNMVTDEDLSTTEDHQALTEEVREECRKFGTLRSIIVPREMGNGVEASAIRKIFLEYADTADAERAEKELSGRQFGSSVVETTFHPEADFASGKLR